MREKLGITSHHPKWAIAFKFESPMAITKLTDIVIQVGRNGRVTPVAILEPVSIAGSVVSRATLHNREYIEILELGRGDTVTISKRGDIIPAVENIIEKSSKNPEIFKFPQKCPFCSLDLEKRGAHHFCINRNCPERRRRELSFFISKERMNIETLGEKTVSFLFDKGYIKRIPDIYKLDYLSLLGEEGFKEKRIKNIINSVEASKKTPFETVLVSLGFEGLSTFAAKELIRAGFNSFEKIISSVEKNNPELFSEIEGFGDITAELIIKHFSDSENIEMIRELGELGLQISEKDEEKEKHSQTFEGQIWVITGSFETFNPRSKAAKEIEVRGGKISTSVSSKTYFLLAGSSPGSKLNRAESLGIRIINEKEFIKMLKKG